MEEEPTNGTKPMVNNDNKLKTKSKRFVNK